MTEILPLVIKKLSQQEIVEIGAVVNKENIAARKVLEHANFEYKASFDLIQDLYESTPISRYWKQTGNGGLLLFKIVV